MKTHQTLRLFLAIFIAALATNVKAQCLTSWKYYVPIVVTNQTSTSLTDYQVKLTVNTATPISSSKMSSTGDDIRFTDSGSCNTLPYWIESGINTSSTVIWVKLPNLPANAHRTIKMFYDNPTATAVSNGDSVFLIFDDFNGTTLNTSKWDTYTSGTGSGSGTLTVSNGILTCSTNLEANIRSHNSLSPPLLAESKITAISGSWETMAILNSGTLLGYAMVMGPVLTSVNTMYLAVTSKPANPSCISYTSGTTNATTAGTLTGIWQLGWPSTSIQFCSWPGNSINATYSTYTLGSGVQLAIGNMCGALGTMSMDWVRARKYAAKEALTNSGNETLNPNIQTSAISGSPFCAGATISIPFTLIGSLSYNSSNTFTAQLSDSAGGFISPINIGTDNSTNGGTISATLPLVSYSSSHYKVRVVSNSPGLVGIISSFNITILGRSTPGFTINTPNQCFMGNSFQFTNTTSGPNNLTYEWDYGDGYVATTTSPTYSYATPGTYAVKLFVTTSPGGCIDSASQIVVVYPNAVAGFTVNNSSACQDLQNFAFTNTSSIASGSLKYLWNFGDGGPLFGGTNATHTYKTGGTFNVVLKAISDKGCVDTFFKTITVYPAPVAGFTVKSTSICLNQQNFTLGNTSTITTGSMSYQWDFGDGSTFTNATNPIYSYKSTGIYNVTLVVTSDKGCVDSTTKTITVSPAPIAGFTIKNASVCLNQQDFTLTNSSTITSGKINYFWDLGDGTATSNGTNPTYTYKSAGNYTIKLVATSDNGCIDSIKKIITVLQSPVASATVTGQTTFCQGGSATLNAGAGTGYAYQWLRNGLPIAGANSATYSVTTSGDYKVAVSTANTCRDSSTDITIKVNPLPKLPLITQNGRTLSTGRAVGYQWNIANGGSISGADSENYNPTVNKGQFTVTIIDSNGCSNTSVAYNYDETGINNIKYISNINIYPNPVHDVLNIDLSNSKININTIQLLDINGRLLQALDIRGNRNIIEMKMNGLTKGLYFIKLGWDDGVLVNKIITE